jgi:hypothetical protein
MCWPPQALHAGRYITTSRARPVFAEVARATDAAARAGQTPLERLRAGAHAWLEIACERTVQRIVLLDSPTVLGWARWRALDEQHSLGDLRANARRLAREGRLPTGQEEILARMLLAALNEAALFITDADDESAALQTARAAVDTLIDASATLATAAGGR